LSRKSHKEAVRHFDNNTVAFDQYRPQKAREVRMVPRSVAQEKYIAHLLNEDVNVVIGYGPAGTGKTMHAVQAALKAYKEGQCEKIILTRPAVGVEEEEHGFLPGNLDSKMEPWVRPLMDVIAEYYTQRDIAKMLDEKTVEISPLAFLRGRTFKNSWVIFDEAQNATVNQMKMALTRIGEGTKMVITGDLDQLDRKFKVENGLRDFIERIEQTRSSRIASVKFGIKDVQRHPVVAEVLKLYGD